MSVFIHVAGCVFAWRRRSSNLELLCWFPTVYRDQQWYNLKQNYQKQITMLILASIKSVLQEHTQGNMELYQGSRDSN